MTIAAATGVNQVVQPMIAVPDAGNGLVTAAPVNVATPQFVQTNTATAGQFVGADHVMTHTGPDTVAAEAVIIAAKAAKESTTAGDNHLVSPSAPIPGSPVYNVNTTAPANTPVNVTVAPPSLTPFSVKALEARLIHDAKAAGKDSISTFAVLSTLLGIPEVAKHFTDKGVNVPKVIENLALETADEREHAPRWAQAVMGEVSPTPRSDVEASPIAKANVNPSLPYQLQEIFLEMKLKENYTGHRHSAMEVAQATVYALENRSDLPVSFKVADIKTERLFEPFFKAEEAKQLADLQKKSKSAEAAAIGHMFGDPLKVAIRDALVEAQAMQVAADRANAPGTYTYKLGAAPNTSHTLAKT